jgi:tetratricopeptide (TPR) repeat protein
MLSKNVQALYLSLAFCLSLCLADKAQATGGELQVTKAQAMAAAGSGNYEAAIELYNKVISMSREQYGERAWCLADLYLNLGTVAQESGKFQMAEDAYDAAIAINPNSISARLQMADLLKIRDRPQERKQQILKALSVNENSVATRKKLALFYQTQGNQYKAIEEFVKAGKVAERGRITVHPSAGGASHSHATSEPAVSKPTKQAINQAAVLKTLPAASLSKPQTPAKVEASKPVVQVKKTPKPLIKKVKKVERPAAKPSKPRLTKQVAKPDGAMEGLLAEPKELKAVPLRAKAGTLKPKKGMSRGLIPPPPPVVPAYPGMAPPPPAAQPQAQSASPPTKAKPKKARSEAPEEHGSSGSDDFLLDWADKKK